MKRIFFTLGLAVSLILISEPTEAKPKKKRLLGYWIVQDHVSGRADALVRFYNSADSLVFEQNLGKKQIALNPRNVKKLNKELKNYRKSQRTKEKFMITKL
ncbi:MAG: hypothetical protein RIF33_24115 [Cyclobacteriaceae bacterium]